MLPFRDRKAHFTLDAGRIRVVHHPDPLGETAGGESHFGERGIDRDVVDTDALRAQCLLQVRAVSRKHAAAGVLQNNDFPGPKEVDGQHG
jgi:hypothetical protein